jgi:hypothetical protein
MVAMKLKFGDFARHLPPAPILLGAALYLLLVAVVFQAIWDDGDRMARTLAAIVAAVMVGVPTFSLWSKHMDRSYIRDLSDQAIAERDARMQERLVIPDSPAGLE